MQKQPMYLVIDNSGSMQGEAFESLKTGIQTLLYSLRQDPYALGCFLISIISFDRSARVIVPLTPLNEFVMPELDAPQSGPTMLGLALDLLCNLVDKDDTLSSAFKERDLRPLVFLITDGKPSDISRCRKMTNELKKRSFAVIAVCEAGVHADTSVLKDLATHKLCLDTCDAASFSQFFNWVSDTVIVPNQDASQTQC